ncbi:MAG: efflux RND transporter periplasmic adaptor subunit [Lentisphaerae bacterium]|nr:efflux RND transporter periplasmic adaptor subunit [Lentisphaerota bacterium]
MSGRGGGRAWIGWVLALGGLGGGWWWWDSRRGDGGAPEYRTAVVARGDIVQTVTASGQLIPLVKVEVGSQVSGNIREIHADYNSTVTNGQLIAVLDPATYEARLIQAEGDLASVRAQLTLAQVNAKRAAELRKANLIAESEFDQTTAELEQRQAAVKVREANVASARVDVERTKIYSPIDGTVISRSVDVGQTVQASFSAPKLFLIARDLARMQIEAMVSEADVGGVAVGQEVSFTVEAFPTRTFEGRVSQVRNEAVTTQNVVTYATIIDVANDDLKLKPGMTANVTITIAKRTDVVRVPNAALRFRVPENAVVRSNAVTAAAATAPTGTAAAAEGPPPGGEAAGRREGRGPQDPEMRARMLARFDRNGDGQLDDAERAAMRAEFGGRGGPRGGNGGGSDQPQARTAYRVIPLPAAGAVVAELDPVSVTCGISDGSYSEALGGVAEGDVVAVGTVSKEKAPATAAAGGLFGAPPMRRP